MENSLSKMEHALENQLIIKATHSHRWIKVQAKEGTGDADDTERKVTGG